METKSRLAGITMLEIEHAVRAGIPFATVRQDGQVVFNEDATKVLGWPGTAEGLTNRTYFKAGGDTEGNIYLIPALATDKNVIKATKNNNSCQFRQDGVFGKLLAEYKDKYMVTEEKEGDVIYFLLTKQPRVAAKEGEEGKAKLPVKTNAEIKASMERRAPSKTPPTAKELEIAAKKAAKQDFKKGK